jgi:hypothetical protein
MFFLLYQILSFARFRFGSYAKQETRPTRGINKIRTRNRKS